MTPSVSRKICPYQPAGNVSSMPKSDKVALMRHAPPSAAR